MRLVITTIGWIVPELLGYLPDVPSLTGVSLPFPTWIPAGAVLSSLGVVVTCGASILLVRAVRWGYGLIPVIQ